MASIFLSQLIAISWWRPDDINHMCGYRIWVRRTHQHWRLLEHVRLCCGIYKVDKPWIEAKASGISAAQELQNRCGRESKVSADKLARALLVRTPSPDWMSPAPPRATQMCGAAPEALQLIQHADQRVESCQREFHLLEFHRHAVHPRSARAMIGHA
jgi:hypothetical protein